MGLALAWLAAAGIMPAAAAAGTAQQFTDVDRHALAAPSSAAASIESLAAYLAQGTTSDLERARAAFRWITNSIAYDTDSFFSGRIPSQSPASALSTRRGVCAGYAGLFAALARRMGLEVEVVSGYAKGWGYTPGAAPGKTNHDWNAVRIDGQWRLLDCTWGAGYVSDAKRFVKEFAEFYFLTPPEQFVTNHLPADPKWQLLDTAWTPAQFGEAVFVWPAAHGLGIVARSHPRAAISTSGRERLEFDAPADILLIAQVEGNENLTLTQAVAGGFEVNCAFRDPGRYTLRIFAKRSKDPGSYAAAIEYAVTVSPGAGASAFFPSTYSNYALRGIVLDRPLSLRLKAGTEVEFSLKIPGATRAAVISGGAWTWLTLQGEQWTAAVKISQGDIQVCAQFPGSDRYEGLLGYTGQ
jgi:transglutaminase/protease-like cytokinesis protein 3